MSRGIFGRLLTPLLFATALVAGAAHAVPFGAVVTFGDSLADSGNNAIVFDLNAPPGTPPGALRTPIPIDSPAFVPLFPYASNRYSNGPVWAEQFAALLGLDAAPSLLGGTNFAFGGAITGPLGSPFPFSLREQVSMFLSQTGGVAAPETLYVVQGGGNDAREALLIGAVGGDFSSVIANYAINISEIITELVTAGARDILIANTPDIGKIPSTQALGPDVSALGTLIASELNAALDAVLTNFVFPESFALHRLDLFGLLNELVADPGAFGMTDVSNGCAFDPACIADPATTFFWDGLHPTTAGHALIAQAAFAEVTAVPEPATPVLLLSALVAAAAAGGRVRLGGRRQA
jgi:outer membrane lipase/esterase